MPSAQVQPPSPQPGHDYGAFRPGEVAGASLSRAPDPASRQAVANPPRTTRTGVTGHSGAFSAATTGITRRVPCRRQGSAGRAVLTAPVHHQSAGAEFDEVRLVERGEDRA
jgi:hypothetical protein